MEPIETRLARLEEIMVFVRSDTSKTIRKLDELSKSHWQLVGKVLGYSAAISLSVTVITTVVMRLVK